MYSSGLTAKLQNFKREEVFSYHFFYVCADTYQILANILWCSEN